MPTGWNVYWNETKLSYIYKNELKQYGEILPFERNVNPMDSNTLKLKYNFLNQILNRWFGFTYIPAPVVIPEVIIWFNSTI